MPRPISYAVFCLKKKTLSLSLATATRIAAATSIEGTSRTVHKRRDHADLTLRHPRDLQTSLAFDLILSSYHCPRDLHSFPTRRSSDLPQSHLSFCVLLQYLVERRRVVTQILKQNEIGRTVQQECRDRYRMPSSA